jgi:KDO2-lipid IV(A) lauroyltransferase
MSAADSASLAMSRAPTLRDRTLASVLIGGAGLLRHLPDGLVYRAAHAAGAGACLLMPGRRALVRSNLGRVCRWLDENDRASPRVRAAARDEHALDRLVRDAFGHWFRTYAEAAMAPRYDQEALHARIRLDTVEAAEAALGPAIPGRGRIYIGFHFGSVELAALYAARESQVSIAGPMESVANPALRAYFESARGALGIGLVPLHDAARELTARLARGDGVALVSDRVISGAGSRVELFGAPIRVPIGPAVLAAESGAEVFVIGMRRTGWARWAAVVMPIELEVGAPRRVRVRDALDKEMRALELLVAEAPEQWWSLFFPLWEAA